MRLHRFVLAMAVVWAISMDTGAAASTNGSAQSAAAGANSTFAFQGGNLAAMVYYANYTCSPPAAIVFQNSSESSGASSVASCEFGSGSGVNAVGSTPEWVLIPAFAGFSVFGFSAQGATPQGYPVYNGITIATQCGAGGTRTTCRGGPAYLYSPIYSAFEGGINVTKGMGGLPEGVLPSAASDYLVPITKNTSPTLSRVVEVLVFDPNVFPNATTGRCRQVAASGLANATANCLTSAAALQAAIGASDAGVQAINTGNPLWSAAGSPLAQATILNVALSTNRFAAPLVQEVANANATNTNLLEYSYATSAASVQNSTKATTSTSTTTTFITVLPQTTISQQANAQQHLPSAYSMASLAIAAAIVAIFAWYLRQERKEDARLSSAKTKA